MTQQQPPIPAVEGFQQPGWLYGERELLPEATRLGVEFGGGRMASCFSKSRRWSLFNSFDMAFGQDDLNLAWADGCGPEPGYSVKTATSAEQ